MTPKIKKVNTYDDNVRVIDATQRKSLLIKNVVWLKKKTVVAIQKALSIFIFILHYTFGSFKLWTFYDEYYTII